MMGWDDVIYAVILMVASAAINAMLTPRPPKQADPVPSSLNDFNVPTTTEGTPQAVYFGECWSGDWTVLWYGDLQSVSFGGNGGGGGKK